MNLLSNIAYYLHILAWLMERVSPNSSSILYSRHGSPCLQYSESLSPKHRISLTMLPLRIASSVFSSI